MKKYIWIGAAYEDLRKAKETYRYRQLNTEILKGEVYNPYDTDFSKWDWEMDIQYQIDDNKYTLRNLEKEIRELHKIIKKMNREQNLEYNKKQLKNN